MTHFLSQGFLHLQVALDLEPSATGRTRSNSQTLLPSPRLIQKLNEEQWSDSVVMCVRALAAHHMLQHQSDFEMSLQAQNDPHEPERSVFACCCCAQLLKLCMICHCKSIIAVVLSCCCCAWFATASRSLLLC